MDFEYFKMDYQFEDYVLQCYPKSAKRLLPLLPTLHTLSFLYQYDQFQKNLGKQVLKGFLYSFVLLVMGIVLGYFYIYRFEPSIRGLLLDYGTDLSLLGRYRMVIKVCLILFNMLVAAGVGLVFLIQSKDLKILLTIQGLSKWPFFKKLISYQYSKMLLLFLQFDMKTSLMLKFLREASIGDINKWLSYHIESQLDQGVVFAQSLDENYFDQMMIDFMGLGYHHQDVKGYLEQYCNLMQGDVKLRIQKYARSFRFIVFTFLILIVALFYSTLYMPLQLLEVL